MPLAGFPLNNPAAARPADNIFPEKYIILLGKHEDIVKRNAEGAEIQGNEGVSVPQPVAFPGNRFAGKGFIEAQEQ